MVLTWALLMSAVRTDKRRDTAVLSLPPYKHQHCHGNTHIYAYRFVCLSVGMSISCCIYPLVCLSAVVSFGWCVRRLLRGGKTRREKRGEQKVKRDGGRERERKRERCVVGWCVIRCASVRCCVYLMVCLSNLVSVGGCVRSRCCGVVGGLCLENENLPPRSSRGKTRDCGAEFTPT